MPAFDTEALRIIQNFLGPAIKIYVEYLTVKVIRRPNMPRIPKQEDNTVRSLFCAVGAGVRGVSLTQRQRIFRGVVCH